MSRYSYDPVPASMVPGGIIWVTPRRHQNQIIETSYSRGIPAGREVNYDADEGDPWMRVTDHARNGAAAYYRLREAAA